MSEFSIERCSDELRLILEKATAAGKECGVVETRHVLTEYMKSFSGKVNVMPIPHQPYQPTRRDYFAARIMPALLHRATQPDSMVAATARTLADAMIAELDRTETKNP